MNTIFLTRHSEPIRPDAQSLLKLQYAANKITSASFSQYLTAKLNSTNAPADGIARQSPVTSQISAPVAAPSVPVAAPSAPVAAPSAPVAAPQDTPLQIANQLVAGNQLPPSQPLQPVNAPLYGGAYMQEITYNGFVTQANLENQNAADVYQLNMSNWSLNETQRDSLGLPSQPPPTAPQYVAVNNAGFNQWWASLSNFGDPAPVTFINPIA